MSNNATDMLVSATVDFLRIYPPFDRMDVPALRFLAERVRLAYYPKNSQIVVPNSEEVRLLRIIQRGKVVARQANEITLSESSTLTLGPGELFPIGSVTARRASTNSYDALDDVFCYELAADDYFELMQQSTAFNLYCTQYIASLLGQSRQQLQMQFSQRVAEQQTMNSPLSSIVRNDPEVVGPDTPVRRAVEMMAKSGVGSMVVVDDENKPLGIFTQSDVLKRIVLTGLSLDTPIREVMTLSPFTLPLSACAHDAALTMVMQGVHHVLAVDEEGRLKGVVSERDLFTFQRVGLSQIRQSIDAAANMEMLLQVCHDVRQLSLNMLAQGVGAEQITQFISALNDAVTRRVIELNLKKHDLFGIEWAWLAFGSEGREEQTFSTDQDNGIIYAHSDLLDRKRTQLRLLEFSRDVNADLNRCGFPLCPGNIMASNPELCLTPDQWEDKFFSWIREPDPQALLNASIFFDFRPVYGSRGLADRMRTTILRQAADNPIFQRMLALNALSVRPPLGKIRDFATDLDPEHPGMIDLKKYGSRLFTDAARVFALAHDVGATSTVHRLKQVAPLVNVSAADTAAAIDAFNFIQLMRLRHQYAEREHGPGEGNLIRPDELNEVERRILKEAFRQARRIQQHLKLVYQL